MASGYVTSDGKDLDARYLGINAKAKSATTADSVAWGSVTGKPSIFTSANALRTGTVITLGDTYFTGYTAPSNGVLYIAVSLHSGTRGKMWYINGVGVYPKDKYVGDGELITFFLKKGDRLTLDGGTHKLNTGIFSSLNIV